MSRRYSVSALRIATASTLIVACLARGQIVNNSAAAGGVVNLGSASGTPPQTLTYGVDVGIGESDNVTLVSTNKVSQTIAIADADFDIKEQSRLFDVDAKGNFSDLDYLQNAYGNQLIGRFDGTGEIALMPEHINWVLQESFGQAQIDPFASVTPTNLENVNYVSTGPDFAMRLGPTFFLDVTARYARTTYQTDPLTAIGFSAAWHSACPCRRSPVSRSTPASTECCSTTPWLIPISTAAVFTATMKHTARAPIYS